MKIISRAYGSGPCNIGENLKTNFGGPGFTFLPFLAQRILFLTCRFRSRGLTLAQGFDYGSKYDYWSCIQPSLRSFFRKNVSKCGRSCKQGTRVDFLPIKKKNFAGAGRSLLGVCCSRGFLDLPQVGPAFCCGGTGFSLPGLS